MLRNFNYFRLGFNVESGFQRWPRKSVSWSRVLFRMMVTRRITLSVMSQRVLACAIIDMNGRSSNIVTGKSKTPGAILFMSR